MTKVNFYFFKQNGSLSKDTTAPHHQKMIVIANNVRIKKNYLPFIFFVQCMKTILEDDASTVKISFTIHAKSVSLR